MKRFYFVGFFIFLNFIFTTKSIFASSWVTSATLNDKFSLQVEPTTTISANINVNTWIDNSNSSDTPNWYSTQYIFSGQTPICVDTPNYNTSGFHNQTFNLSSPSTDGIYNLTFKLFLQNLFGEVINLTLTLFKRNCYRHYLSLITIKSESIGNTATIYFQEICFNFLEAEYRQISLNVYPY
jgi:hypothetical protein